MNKHYFEVVSSGLNPDFRESLYHRAGGWQNVFTYGKSNGNLVLEVPASVKGSIAQLLMDWEISVVADSDSPEIVWGAESGSTQAP